MNKRARSTTAKTAKTTKTADRSSGAQDPGTQSKANSTNHQNEDEQGESTTGDDLSGTELREAADSQENPPREAESRADATRRWRSSGIADQVAVYRDTMREQYRKDNPGCKRREAHDYAWECALAKYPRPGVEPTDPEPAESDDPDEPEPEEATAATDDDGGEVPGLGDLPPDWGDLPANASLQVEISWVSANRLRVRKGSGVDLSKALSPAPSYSALSWLETSILFPSKFADISVKATQNQEDEKEAMRREKLAIEEVRSLLAEMLEDRE